MRLLLALLLSIPLAATTARLRVGPTLFLTSTQASGATTQMNFHKAHGLVAGTDWIYCYAGPLGDPALNAKHLKVLAVVDSDSITVQTDADANIPYKALAGDDVELGLRAPGIQLAKCGRTEVKTFLPHPRGLWPTSTYFPERMAEIDGATGPAPYVTSSPINYGKMITQANMISTPGCNPTTGAGCDIENALNGNNVSGAYALTMLAVAWQLNQTSTRYRDSALRLVARIPQTLPWNDTYQDPNWFSVDPAVNATNVPNAMYDSYALFNAGLAYERLRGEMDSTQRTNFLKQLLWDESDGCTPVMAPLAGRISGSGNTVTAGPGTSFSGLTPGTTFYVRYQTRAWHADDGTWAQLDIAEGGLATITTSATTLPPNNAPIYVSGTGIAGFADGWYQALAPTGNIFSIQTTATVCANCTRGAGAYIRYPGGSAGVGTWLKVSVNNGATLTLSGNLGGVAINAPFGTSTGWTSNSCGSAWSTHGHAEHTVAPGFRFMKIAAAVPANQDWIPITASTWEEALVLPLPFTAQFGASELIRCTGRDNTLKRLTGCARGYLYTLPAISTAANGTNYVIYGAMRTMIRTTSSTTTYSYMNTRKGNRWVSYVIPLIVALSAAVDDMPSAIPKLEFYWASYIDDLYRTQLEAHAFHTFASTASYGYWQGMYAQNWLAIAVLAKNSFTEPVDLSYEGLRVMSYARQTMARAGARNHFLSAGDSGSGRSFEADEWGMIGFAHALWPTDEHHLRNHDDFQKTFNFTSSEIVEWLGLQALWISQPNVLDYTAAPLAYLGTEPAQQGLADAVHGTAFFRSSWTDAKATTVQLNSWPDWDQHAGSYADSLQFAVGPPAMIGGARSTLDAGHGDMAAQWGPISAWKVVEASNGGLVANGLRKITRGKIGSNWFYARDRWTNIYDPAKAPVTDGHRDVIVLGDKWLVVYDHIKTSATVSANQRVPYNNMQHTNSAVQTPPATFSRIGRNVRNISTQYGVGVASKFLLPASDSAYDVSALPKPPYTSPAVPYGSIITINLGTGTEFEVFSAHKACITVDCPIITPALLDTSAGYRAVQINDGDDTWVTGASSDSLAVVTGVVIQTQPYVDSAHFRITGLTGAALYTEYMVLRDGVEFLANLRVDSSGTLAFEAERGTGAGVFTISSTGTAPLSIATSSLPTAVRNQPYSTTLLALGGQTPYSGWGTTTACLPAGLSIAAATGVLSGTPTASGTFNCTFKVDDAASDTPTATRALSLVVSATALSLALDTTSLPNGTVGQAYAAQLVGSGGTLPYSFGCAGGMPPGVSVSTTGSFTGIPSTEGAYSMTCTVTDALAATASRGLTITIVPPAPVSTNADVAVLGTTGALIRFGASTLRGDQAATISVTLTDDTPVLELSDQGGPATRYVGLRGLEPSTTYRVTIVAGGGWSAEFEFTTLADRGSAAWKFSAQPGLGTQMSMSYSLDGSTFSAASTQSCTPRCSFNVANIPRGTLLDVTYTPVDGFGQPVSRATTIQVVTP